MAGSITTATLVARLIADTTMFTAGLRSADAGLTGTTARMVAMGNSAGALAKKMMVPAMAIAAFGGVAVKMAVEWEHGLTKIATLTTATTEDVAAFADTMMRVSSEVGIGPNKLSEGMFLLASSGLSAKSAMSALEMSAQASALGLGDVGTIADAVSSGINAYGEANLSARDATNALINAVKMGKMKPEELAGAIGKVIPIAKSMGVTFQEVVADMASLTQIGLSSSIASTALRATMIAIVHPTKDASAALAIMSQKNADIPKTFADIRAAIEQHGLVPTLQSISTAVNGDVTAMTKLFPEARALTGVLAWTGANAKNSARNYEALAANTDMLAKGMDYLAKQPGFQLKRSMNELQISMMKFGDAILPAVSKMMTGYAAIFHAFSSLPKPILFAVGVAGAFFVSLTLLLWVFGKIAAAVELVTAAIEAMTVAEITAEAVNPFLALAAAVALVVTALWALNRSAGPPKDLVDAMTNSLRDNKTALDDTTVAMLRKSLGDRHQMDDLKRLESRLTAGTHGFALFLAAVDGNKRSQREFRQALLDSGEIVLKNGNHIEASAKAQAEWVRTGKQVTQGSLDSQVVMSGNVGLYKTFTDAIAANKAAHKTLREELAGTTDGMTAFENAQAAAQLNGQTLVRTLDDMKADLEATDAAASAAKTSLDWLFGASTGLVEAEIAQRRASAEMIKTLLDGNSTFEDNTDAVVRNFTALQELAAQQARNNVPLTEWKNNLADGAAAMIDQAINAHASTDVLKKLAEAMNLPKDVISNIGLPGIDNKQLMLTAFLQTLQQIDGTDPNSVVTLGADTSGAIAGIGAVNSALGAYITQWTTYWTTATGNPAGSMGPNGPQAPGPRQTPTAPVLTVDGVNAIELANAFQGWASGGITTHRQMRLIGEGGPEAVVPLGSSPSAQRNRARVLAQAGIGSDTSVVSAGASSTNNTYHVTVNVPATADAGKVGQSVVDALVAWSRRNGAVPISTR